MNENWRDVIVELIHLGCSIRISGDNLQVRWEGRGSLPSQEKFSSLVEILKAHKEEILNNPYFLIDQTLKEINEIWQPGFLNYLKFSRPGEWERVLRLEERINQCVFKGDLNELKKSLSEYRELITGIVKQFRISGKQKELLFQQNACLQ